MTILDWLKSTEIIIGLVMLACGGIAGALAYWDRRARRYFDGKAMGLKNTALSQDRRLEHVETSLKDIDGDLERLKIRMSQVESSLERLAGLPSDLNQVSISLARVTAILEQQSNQITILYRAAWEASKKGGPDT